MSTTNEKLTRLKHLVELGTRTKAELDALESQIQDLVTVGGEPNVIEKISLNGVEQTITDKAVNLEISHPEYTVVKAADSGDYAAVYNLTKDGTVVGASINIPKDLVVKSGSVVGNNIVLVLNDEDATEITIPVDSLIEYVTSGSATGDMVVITVDASTHKVSATITDGTITAAKLTAEVQTALNKAHEHANKALLDTYTQTEENLADAVSKKHSHSNKTVLDGITEAKVSAWDATEQNAKDYADGLNTAMNTRVAAIESDYLTSANIAADSDVTAALNDVFGE